MSRAAPGTSLHATPRGVASVMERTTYATPAPPPTRQGADDAARIPSLQNGKEVAHKAPTLMASNVRDFAYQDTSRYPKTAKKAKSNEPSHLPNQHCR